MAPGRNLEAIVYKVQFAARNCIKGLYQGTLYPLLKYRVN